MDELIRARYNETILQEALRRFGISRDRIRSLDAFESFIYEYDSDAQAYILRVSHSSRRSEALIHGEVEWINFLADGGLSVSRAVLSARGELVEMIEDAQGGAFLVTAFLKARGKAPWDLWNPHLYESYGRLIGRMHALSKDFHPSRPEWKRPDWDDAIFEFVERYLPPAESLARAKYEESCRQVNTIAKDGAGFGLTHQDAHGSNLFVDERGQITLFDFDECAYHWFVNDIAVVLFYIVQDADDWPAFTREFMTHFLSGYRRACPLDSALLKEIPNFLKIREIELYAVMHRDFDVDNITNEWCSRFMRGRKSKIERDIPYIDFDFETLSSQL